MIDYKEQYDLIDKSSWRDGIWKQEPDRVSWIDPETGYHCLINRNHKEIGVFCGYVAIEKRHPFYGKEWTDDDYYVPSELSVHGGINYSATCFGDELTGICHKTEGKDKAWWFGFDCGHAWDLSPGMESLMDSILPNRDFMMNLKEDLLFMRYRDLPYCKDQVQSLAKQLKEIETGGH